MVNRVFKKSIGGNLKATSREQAVEKLAWFDVRSHEYDEEAHLWAERLRFELASPDPLRKEDPQQAIYATMNEYAFTSSTSSSVALKTIGLLTCQGLVSYGTKPDGSTIGAIAHCTHTGNHKDLIQALFEEYRTNGIADEAVHFEIHGWWHPPRSLRLGEVAFDLDVRLAEEIGKYSPHVKDELKMIHRGAILFDVSQRRTYQLFNIDFNSPEYKRRPKSFERYERVCTSVQVVG